MRAWWARFWRWLNNLQNVAIKAMLKRDADGGKYRNMGGLCKFDDCIWPDCNKECCPDVHNALPYLSGPPKGAA